MTQESLKEGLSLFGFNVSIERECVTFEHDKVDITIYRGITEEEVKLLLMNIPRWFHLAVHEISG